MSCVPGCLGSPFSSVELVSLSSGPCVNYVLFYSWVLVPLYHVQLHVLCLLRQILFSHVFHLLPVTLTSCLYIASFVLDLPHGSHALCLPSVPFPLCEVNSVPGIPSVLVFLVYLYLCTYSYLMSFIVKLFWVHCTQMASTVARSRCGRASLECGGAGDLLNLQAVGEAIISKWTKISEERFGDLVESMQ